MGTWWSRVAPLYCCGYVSVRKLSKHDRTFLLEEEYTGETIFTEQQIAIRTLNAGITKFQQIYEYYHECCLVAKARAVLYEMEKRDHRQAMVHVFTARRYEESMQVISNFQTKFIDAKMKLQLLINTSESLELLQNYSIVLKSQLDKIHKELDIKKTLETLEKQTTRIQTMEDLIATSANQGNVIQNPNLERDLQVWCKKPAPIFEPVANHVPGSKPQQLQTFLPLLNEEPSSPSLPTQMVQIVQMWINQSTQKSEEETNIRQTEDTEDIILWNLHPNPSCIEIFLPQ